ncbi:DUF1189 domain-containing protein [Bacillus salitolerans]|uniref:DUF1189 domain-containing protein n=1 Tax=Bacillus salitolerans TaxID=1437434 RepID=A0ABW4LNX1_9BACI
MTIFKQYSRSLYSPKDIAKLRFQTIGKTILYVFLLSLLSIIPSSIYSSYELVQVTNDLDEMIEKAIPDFSIQNGELVSSVTEPTTFTHQDLTIVFDPTEQSRIDLSSFNKSIGLFKHEFAYHFGTTTQTIPYDMLESMTINKLTILSFVQSFLAIQPIIIALIILASYILAAGVKFIEISLLALIGLTLVRIVQKQLPYRRLWAMSAYSITLPLTFLTIMELLKITVISSYGVYWLVSIVMLFLALKEIPAKKIK